MEEAETLLDEVIARTPDDADAWYNRATIRRQTPERNHVAALRAVLAGRSPGASPVALHYALAKELEDLGEYAESFAALAQGAAARRRCSPTRWRPTSRPSHRSSVPSTALV
jgi:predicted Zn-dependent protease